MNDVEPLETPEQPDSSSEHEEIEVQPTYAPAAMSLGITMFFWGATTMWLMSVAGAAVMIWSLWTWISAMRDDWRKEIASE